MFSGLQVVPFIDVVQVSNIVVNSRRLVVENPFNHIVDIILSEPMGHAALDGMLQTSVAEIPPCSPLLLLE